MKTLDNLYREEMHYLKALAEVIATEQPHLRDFVAPHHSDAFVEKLLEAFSLLSADFKKHLNSAFPEITLDYLRQVCPFMTDPIPMTTVLQFDHSNKKIIDGVILPRSSSISFTQGNVTGELKTCRDLTLTPISIENKSCYTSASNSEIVLNCRFNGKKVDSKHQELTFYLGNDIKLAKKLQFSFTQKLKFVQLKIQGETYLISPEYLNVDYPSEENRVLPSSNNHNWPLQTFIEGLYLPHVYDFLHLRLPIDITQFFETEDQTFELCFIFDEDLKLNSDALSDSFILNCVPAYSLQEAKISNLSLREGYQNMPLALEDKNFNLYAVTKVSLHPKVGANILNVIPHISEYHPRFRLLSDNIGMNYFYDVRPIVVNRNKTQYLLRITDKMRNAVSDLDELGCVIEYTRTNLLEYQIPEKQLICQAILASNSLSCTNISATSRYYPPLLSSEKHWPLMSFIAQSPFFLNDVEVIKQSINTFAFHGEIDIHLERQIKHYSSTIIAIKSQPIDRLVGSRIGRGYNVELILDETSYANHGEIYFFTHLLSVLFSNTITEKSFILMDVFNQDSSYLLSLPQMTGQRNSL